MIVIMTGKKLKRIRQDFYSRGVARGYELGCQMHEGEIGVRCKICGRQFKSIQALGGHTAATHQKEKSGLAD